MDIISQLKRMAPDAARPVAFNGLSAASSLTLPRSSVREARDLGSRPCRVLAGPLRGATFLNPVGQRSPALLLGWYETHVVDLAKDYAGRAGVVFDIGASAGYHALVFARRLGPAGAVHAFEPSPRDRAILTANLRLNSAATVLVDDRAVADVVGTAPFTVFDSPGVHHLTRDDTPGDGRQIQVGTVSLDAYVFEEGHRAPDFIKVDVEGGEVSVLQGAARLLREIRPAWVVEVHRGSTYGPVEAIARRNGYRTFHLADHSRDVCDIALLPQA